ncbi:MAG TPA: 4-alpha-glucanotransferase [Kofleriaceae bacterium]|nr:4-alpha-glucanotransferase [Kofleriaceae bacterium]
MDALSALAVRAGVEASYTGWNGEPVHAPPDALCAIVRALGHDVQRPDDAAKALRAAERAHWEAGAAPAIVDWGAGARLPLRVAAEDDGDWELEIRFESGRTERREGRLFDLPARDHAWPDAFGGRVHCKRDIAVPGGELGYHTIAWRFTAGALRREGTTHVIAAPPRAWGAPGEGARRWGLFAPVHALRADGTGDTGDLGTLARLRAIASERGASYVATLPLLAAFLDEPCQPSPYSPASRLFWNELYLPLDARGPAPRGELIDYRAQYAWRRAVIDRDAAAAWNDPVRANELRAFAADERVTDYAVFRAIGEAERTSWTAWPAELRDGVPVARSIDELPDGVDRARVLTHIYAQHAMDRELGAQARAGAAGLYVDLPVGVSCDAYEVWRDRSLFALAAAAGAPPDPLFLGGQDWGLPPILPERSRATGHAYFAACVRHHMRHASMLRIDHAMGLWRLYWVPPGFGAKDGVYVRYPADELCAVLTLESHRHACAVAGEDLGTVPEHVRPAMARHGFYRLHVMEFAMPARAGDAPGAAPPDSVASLNTHDTPTFGGWWHGTDVDDRRALGLITEERARDEHAERLVSRAALLDYVDREKLAPRELPDEPRALHGAQADLAASAAEVVLVTVEDLWLEPKPQNVPGTSTDRPNWRRAFAKPFESITIEPSAIAALDAVESRRPSSVSRRPEDPAPDPETDDGRRTTDDGQ